MPTLLISTWRLPAAEALAGAARRRGWQVAGLDREPEPHVDDFSVFYGGTDVADAVAARFDLALVEPPFDLLTRTPYALRLRAVEYARYDELRKFDTPTFVKPADPRRKAFDAGIYRDVREARLESALDPRMPVLVAEPVEWLEEHRCFVLDGELVASSPYLRFGRPVWRPFNHERRPVPLLPQVREVCRRLPSSPELSFPPAFVVDIGYVDGRGWAVVEYHPAWCSSLLGADPAGALSAIARASRSRERLSAGDQAWIAAHPPDPGRARRREQDPAWTGAHAGAMT